MGTSSLDSTNLGVADRCTLRVGVDELTFYSHYDSTHSVFNQPSSFSCRIGDGGTAAAIIKKYPPRTPVQVSINGQPQFSGYTEGYRATGGANAATEVSLHGKCILERLRKFWLSKHEEFNSQTYVGFVNLATNLVELQKPFAPPGTRPSVIDSNSANRQQSTGSSVVAQNDTTDTTLLQIAGSNGNKYQCLRLGAGERLLDLLRRELDTVGLFMWASGAGDIIVGRPNPKQPSIARLLRTRNTFDDGMAQFPKLGTIEEGSLDVDMSERYSDIAIYGRSFGKKRSRTLVNGAFTDDELVSLGYTDQLVVRDAHATTLRQCEHLAALRHADARRKAFKLEYVVSGHSVPGIGPAQGKTIVWSPDIMVDIFDDELGLEGPYYLETVRHVAAPQAQTHLTFVEPLALTFADGTTSA